VGSKDHSAGSSGRDVTDIRDHYTGYYVWGHPPPADMQPLPPEEKKDFRGLRDDFVSWEKNSCGGGGFS